MSLSILRRLLSLPSAVPFERSSSDEITVRTSSWRRLEYLGSVVVEYSASTREENVNFAVGGLD